MPFLPQNSYDEEQKKLQQNQGGTGTNISGESGTFELPGASQNANAPKPKQGSGSFANLNSYLDANKEQAKTMGTQVAGNVAAKADDAQSSLNNTFESFTNQANQQKVTADQSILDGIQNDPLSITSNAEKLAQAQKMRTAAYNGPSDLVDVDGFGEAQSKITNANDQLKSLGTETGRAAALQDTYKRPSYTRGQVSLDQALVQKSPDAQNEILSVQNRYGDLLGVLDGKQTAATQQAAAIKASNDATRSSYQSVIGQEDDLATEADERSGALGSFQNSLEKALAEYRSGEGNQLNRIVDQSHSRTFDQDILDLLGLTAGTRNYNTDFNSLLPTRVDLSTINAQNIASADDYAKYQALQQLAGGSGSLLPSERPAGTESVPRLKDFDTKSFANAIKASQARYESDYANASGNYLDRTLFTNPGADPNLMIPWNRVDAAHQGKFTTATPKELETYWYPLMNQLANETGYASERQNANAILQSVNQWKNSRGYNQVISKK